MKTHTLRVDADFPEPSKIEKVARILKDCGTAAIPTETVYGLACNAQDKKALERLCSIKERAETKPFTIQIASFSQVRDHVNELPPGAEAILKEFWPGPLTVILNGKDGKVGLRMPDNKVALSIIKEAKVPLAVTSANISGRPSALSAEEVLQIFNGKIDLIVDDGSAAGGIESTILDCSVIPFMIVRKGSISGKLKGFVKEAPESRIA